MVKPPPPQPGTTKKHLLSARVSVCWLVSLPEWDKTTFALECCCTPPHLCSSFVLEDRKPAVLVKEEEKAAPKKKEAEDQSRRVEKRSPPAGEAKPGIQTLVVRVVSRPLVVVVQIKLSGHVFYA